MTSGGCLFGLRPGSPQNGIFTKPLQSNWRCEMNVKKPLTLFHLLFVINDLFVKGAWSLYLRKDLIYIFREVFMVK